MQKIKQAFRDPRIPVIGLFAASLGLYGILKVFKPDFADPVIVLLGLWLSFLSIVMRPNVEKAVRALATFIQDRRWYVDSAATIYTSGEDVYALIEGWDARDEYLRALRSDDIGNIQIMGPVETGNTSILGALVRLCVAEQRKDKKVVLLHIDRKHVYFKMVVGQTRVLVGEEYGVTTDPNLSDSGHFIPPSQFQRFPQFFRLSFEALHPHAVPLETRIQQLARDNVENLEGKNPSVVLRELVANAEAYRRFFARHIFVKEADVVEMFEKVLNGKVPKS